MVRREVKEHVWKYRLHAQRQLVLFVLAIISRLTMSVSHHKAVSQSNQPARASRRLYEMKNSIIAITFCVGTLFWGFPANTYAIPFSKTVCAGKVVPINSISGGGVLYKPSNLHGGRGPSFLVQNVAERTGKPRIEIRNARCEVIGTLGLFATDQPYGARYYSKSGGSGLEDDQLLALARQVGSSNILIEGVNKWIRVKNPTQRDGSVRK